MAAKYTMQEMKNLRKEGETLLYPKMVMQDCCGTNELARMIAGETTFSTERYGESSASLPREWPEKWLADTR